MLLKKSIDWSDLDIKRRKHNGNVEFVIELIGWILILGGLIGLLFYVINDL